MKTLNGAPQFERDECDLIEPSCDHIYGLRLEPLNEQLREWAASRTCVNCVCMGERGCPVYYEASHFSILTKEQFSCAAFEGEK